MAGFAGVGKTTSLRYLEEMGVGRLEYIGRFIHEEIKRRGMASSASNERLVREQMRQQHGRDVLARKFVEDLVDRPGDECVLLDAIYLRDEADFYRQKLSDRRLIIIGLEATLEIRALRLASREERPLTRPEIAARDAFDRSLGVDAVVRSADFILNNDGDIASLQGQLDLLREQW